MQRWHIEMGPHRCVLSLARDARLRDAVRAWAKSVGVPYRDDFKATIVAESKT